MSNIVPFVPRAAGGDWTAGERERLSELAGKLKAAGADVDAAYGVSDAGDPWCVITDSDEEVLIHVARIDGQFVIHDASADAIEEDDTLWSAFERLMGPGWRDGRDDDMVVPLRQAQSLLAVVAALLFVREFAHIDGEPETPGAPDTSHHTPVTEADAAGALAAHDGHATPPAHPTQAPEDSSPRRQALVAKSAETPTDAPSAAGATVHAEEPAAHRMAEPAQPMALALAAPTPALTHSMTAGDGGATLVGGAGADLIEGGKGGDHLMGAGGNDTLIGHGAQPGQIDLLEGGAGDDRILLAERTVAVGGDGKDTFVVPAPAQATTSAALTQAAKPDGATPEPAVQPTTPVTGVVLDFSVEDKLVFSQTGRVVSVTQVGDVLDGMHGYTMLARQPVTPGIKVGIDYNGDGTADTYVLLSGSGTSSVTVGMKSGDAGFDPGQAEPNAHDQTIAPTGVNPAGSASGDALLG